MKKKVLLLLVLAALVAGAAFAQKVGDTVDVMGQKYTVQEVQGDRLVLQKVTGTIFTTISAFKTWLDSQPDNSNVNPYYVRVNISNVNGNSVTNGSLGNAINNKINANKYIDLDMSGSTFNSIPDNAFQNCKTLINVTMPGRVNVIGNSAFVNCTSLESVTIGSNVTSIGDGAFRYCTSLESITFPASLQGIGGMAFNGCTSLNSVTFQGTIPASRFSGFDGDLKNKFYATNKDNGTPGTYTRAGNTWTKR